MKFRRRSSRMALGILTVGVGFLTNPAWALDPIEEARRCLEAERREIVERDRLLTRADSLGTLLEEAGVHAPESWRRDAERIQREAMERELDLLQRRDQCRRLAEGALRELEARLPELERGVESGRGLSSGGAELLQLRQLRADFQSVVASPAVLRYPDLRPEPSDTQETLEAKLQYYRDVRAYLERVAERLVARASQLGDEARALEEAGRFLRDLSFVDEGGRVTGDGSVRLKGIVPDGSGHDGGMNRPLGEVPGEGQGGSLDFALRVTPTTPEESERLRALLDGYRREVVRELERIDARTTEFEVRLAPESTR